MAAKHGSGSATHFLERECHPLSGTWEAWLAPNVLRATLLSPHVTCRRPEIGFVFRVDFALVRPKSQYVND